MPPQSQSGAGHESNANTAKRRDRFDRRAVGIGPHRKEESAAVGASLKTAVGTAGVRSD